MEGAIERRQRYTWCTMANPNELDSLPRGAVLVATDFTDESSDALTQADAWARRSDAPLIVCHAVPPSDAIRPLLPHLFSPTIDEEQLSVAADAVRRQVSDHTQRRDGDFVVALEFGSPHTVIVRIAEACAPSLVVVGSGGKGSAERLFTGSTSEQVMRHAPVSVLVCRGAEAEGPVVAAVDLSDVGVPALTEAAHEAKRRGSALIAIHAIELPPAFAAAIEPSMALDDEALDAARAAATRILETHFEGLACQGAAHVVIGDPVSSVLTAAAEVSASLIAVATHGHSGLRQLAIGSVAEAIVRAARCSVLVARA
jgi:nucleotide-binding universal stress UspA family protein